MTKDIKVIILPQKKRLKAKEGENFSLTTSCIPFSLGRTIADLENGDIIKAYHVAEAIQYRPRRME